MPARYNRKALLTKLYAAVDSMRLAFNSNPGVASKSRLAHDKRKAIRSCLGHLKSERCLKDRTRLLVRYFTCPPTPLLWHEH